MVMLETVINMIKKSYPAGSISMYAGSTAPTGYLLCDGSAVSRTTYADLFTAIGTTYGTGDGSTTFNVPNVKGKVPVGRDSADTSFDTLGETGGAKEVTLTAAQSGVPAHKHPFTTVKSAVMPTTTTDLPSGYNPNNTGTGTAYTSNNTATNASSSHTNLQPYIVFNYIIKT